MADLTPAEQHFFATGELPPELATPVPDAVATSGLGEAPTAPAPVTQANTPPEAPTPPEPSPQPDITEVLRRSLQEAHARQAQLEAQLAQLQKPPIQQSEPTPDPNVDPLGAMMHQLNQVNKSVAHLQAQLDQQSTQQTQLTQFQQFKAQVETLRDQFAKTTPDFYDAYNHLRTIRAQDLRTFGLPEDQIQQTLLQDEVALSQSAIRYGKNPAQVVYEMAKSHGYTTKTQASPAPTPAAKLSNIQQTPTALPPGMPNPSDITLDSLKQASDADLNKMVMNDEIWGKIAGKDSYPL